MSKKISTSYGTQPGIGRELAKGILMYIIRLLQMVRKLAHRFIISTKQEGLKKTIQYSLGQVVAVPRVFDFWERLGIHVTRVHFYYPIPFCEELKYKTWIWERESELIGIDLQVEKQLAWIWEVCPIFLKEYQLPIRQVHVPVQFGPVDAEVAHCMVRYSLPAKVIEIGSGFSTFVLARACLLNRRKSKVETELSVIDPYPHDTVLKGFPGLTNLRQEMVENIELDFFQNLEAGDILFIDSTHTIRIGGDVNYIYLEVLPRLKAGVIVHIHDIFLPREYPRKWVLEKKLFWSEQYLLQAFLTFNHAYEVLWCGSYMHLHYPAELRLAFPSYDDLVNWPGSFWMRKNI